MALDMESVPDWIKEYVHKLVSLLGLGEWDLRIVMQTRIPGDCLGVAHIQRRYQDATIAFSVNLKPDDEGYVIVTHELLHLVQAAQRLAVDRIIDFTPKRYHDTMIEIWKDQNEPYIQALAKRLMPLFRAAAESR